MKPQRFSGTSLGSVVAVVDTAALPATSPEAASALVGDAIAIVRPEPNALVRSAKSYAGEARSRGTRNAYAKHWTAFAAWCNKQDLCALPAAPQTLTARRAARGEQTACGFEIRL